MSGLLPAGMRCTAYWYAQARGLPTDLDYLKALGATAARMAWWEGLEPWQVPEGPYWVHMWPERIWDAAANGVLQQAAAILEYMDRLHDPRNAGTWRDTDAGWRKV